MNRPEPLLPWGTVAAVAAGGALLLAFFVARSGSSVAVVAALAIAAALAVAALVGRRRATPSLERIPGGSPDESTAGVESHPSRPQRPARAVPTEQGGGEDGGVDGRRETYVRVAGVASTIARSAAERFAAPAVSVLVASQGRLIAAGSAGDWGAARRGLKNVAGPGLYDPSTDDGSPPEFNLDPRADWLPRLLTLYSQPVPMERWHEVEDVPAPLLPLVGLAASGAGVAVALVHRRRLAGLCVLAQRPDGRQYTDAELASLRQLARESGPSLGQALGR